MHYGDMRVVPERLPVRLSSIREKRPEIRIVGARVHRTLLHEGLG